MPSVDTLIDLLKKISRSADHVRVEVDYNGREFNWKVPQSNLTASEYVPRHPRSGASGAVGLVASERQKA